MKVQAKPFVELGTGRGGEDLYLNFEAFHYGEVPPTFEEVVVELATDDSYQDVSVEQQESGKVRYCTGYYEIEWVGTGADFLKTRTTASGSPSVEEYLRTPGAWKFCHAPGEQPKLVCKGSVYLDGNAD